MATWRTRLAQWIAGNPKAVTSGMSIDEFNDWAKGQYSQFSGVVTEGTAMNISAVYACVSLIGGAISSLPLNMYRRDAEGTREKITPDEWWLLNEEPFPSWSAAAAWEYSTQALLLQGDSFWRIHRASRMSPKIVGFEPLHPRTVEVFRVSDRLAYRVSPQPSQLSSPGTSNAGQKLESVTLDQDDMLHVPGPGFNGLRGLSQISSSLAHAGGVALQADEYMNAFFRNSARPDFVLETEGKISNDQLENLRAQWEERYGGAAKSHKPAILTGGMTAKPLTLTASDAQLLETRRFQVEDICRIFGVPPFMVGHTDKTTSWGSGVEQMSIGFVKYTLQRHLVKFEQEVNRKVFRTAARFSEFLTAGIERGDLKTRFEAYRVALGRAGEQPWMTSDEVRRLENLPPDPTLKPNAQGAPNESNPSPAG